MDNPSQKYFGLVDNPNVRNMLELIAKAEGTTEHGHNTAFGGSRFDSLTDHPRYLKPFKQTDGKTNYTSAAGKYQFLSNTWDEVSGKLGLSDFGGQNQDVGAVYLIDRAGALPEVLNGDYKGAANKLGKVWASLPSSPYPQPKRSAGFIENVVNGFLPTAQAGTLPQGQSMLPQTTEKLSGANMNNQTTVTSPERISVNVNNSTMLPNTMAALLGRYPGLINPGGEFRSQDAAAVAPEAIKSLQDVREVKARMLPIAMGALMSGNRGANQFGQAMINPAMSSLENTRMQNGQITPDGQYITDVDSSALMRNLAGLSNNSNGARLPAGEITKTGAEISDFSTFSHLSKVFQPSFSGSTPFEAVGNAENWIGKKFDLGKKEQAEFWMTYQGLINKVRNREFGSALTETERAEFEKAIVRPGMNEDVIRRYIDRQKQLLQSAVERQVLMFKGSGYDTRGIEMGLNSVSNPPQITNTPNTSAPPKPGGKNLSDEELDKLYGG
jgi:muramidase (phage lysozyme)